MRMQAPPVEPSSQYIAHIASQPEVVIFFNGIWTRHDTGKSILFLRRDASKPIEKIKTSGHDASRAIYCIIIFNWAPPCPKAR